METSVSLSLDGLLVRAREGSRTALDRLMVSCRPWLRHRAGTRLPRDLARKQDGSDFVQECQYLAAARFSRFRGRTMGEFRAWMAGILDRRVLRAMRFWGERRRDRHREEPLDHGGSEHGQPAGSTTSILDRLCLDEECERLRIAASWCRDEDRVVIALHLFEGRSHEEIAAALGVEPAAARQRFCRAVRRVGEAMALIELMTRRGLGQLQQDVVGVHRFRGVAPGQIADRFRLPPHLVARWIAEAKPLFRTGSREGS
jgi:RNA polymerase sigma-70 factor, ECF subfamily